MHREVPVRLGKERWETYTATVVQGAHRLLHCRSQCLSSLPNQLDSGPNLTKLSLCVCTPTIVCFCTHGLVILHRFISGAHSGKSSLKRQPRFQTGEHLQKSDRTQHGFSLENVLSPKSAIRIFPEYSMAAQAAFHG